ncbi:MAG: FANCI solenoid 2-domain-containing protein [Benniella sp.]|nr:MAG: FANCI solenoid 2-domain-containing protein [Benniella sp.]
MDTILRLYSQDNTGAALRQYFEEAEPSLDSTHPISNLVLESFQQHGSSFNGAEYGSDCLLLVRAILRASPEEGDGLGRRAQVLRGAISWLIQLGDEAKKQTNSSGSNPLDDVAGKLANSLIDAGQSFGQDALVQSIHTMTDVIRHQRHPHTQMFALLSRVVVIAASADSVLLPDTSEEISGAEFKDIILDRICTAPWNQKSVLPLATALADMHMEGKQLEMAIVKIMKQFKHVDAADLPVLIYNLLLLSSKGHQRLVLRGVLEFFDRLDSGGTMAECLRCDNPKGAARLGFSELSAIESTVILHFNFAVKQDQELGTELLKHMKSGKTAYLSSFGLSCLMAMARIHRFEDSVMEYLKSSILTTFKDMARIQREPWVSSFQGVTPSPILAMFLDNIRKIPFGLEQLTPSIVQCGVYIMDSMAPNSHWRTSDKDLTKRSAPMSPNEHGCELGAIVLAEIFKTQPSARTEILDHIMSRIVTKSTSTLFFLQLLETIVKDSSEALEEHLPRIKESLDYLSFLSLTTAVHLMGAVKDVAKLNRSFRDSLILILRKALFSKTLESRQVALSGFLLLLGPPSKQQTSLRGGSSRIGAHQNAEELPSYSMEILGMLRRCLGQQGEVRLSLYLGLMELVETTPSLNPIIFEILQAHFVHFYDQTGTRLTPLKLEECISNSKTGGEPTFVEPLHYLMCSVVRSLVGLQKLKRRSVAYNSITADERQVAECRRDLDRILSSLEQTGLEDFELDKTSEFNMTTSIGARNNMYATILTGCFESAIEYVILKQKLHVDITIAQGKGIASERQETPDHSPQTGRMSQGSSDMILHLFGKMRKLHDIVKEKITLPRGKKLGTLGENSVLSLECVTKLMELMFSEWKAGERQDEEAIRLRSNDDFVHYISTVVLTLLSKLHASTETLKDTDYDCCRRLSSVLVREFLVSERPDGPKAVAAGAKGKDKNKSLLMIGIEALTAGLLTTQQFYAIKRQTSAGSERIEHHQHRKIVSGFLAATLPQANGGHQPGQQVSEIVAWTTSRTIQCDINSLAAVYIQYLQALVTAFVNETIPLLKEAGGLLGMIQILSKYLSRTTEAEEHSGTSGIDSILSRSNSASSSAVAESNVSQLDQLVHWLVTLCRDQALDDPTLTKTLLSMMLQLEQDCTSPGAIPALLPALNGQNSAEHSASQNSMALQISLGFGSVNASSATSHCPEATARLRLAADVLLTYGMNYGGPHVPSFQDLPDRVPQGQEVDEDIARLIQLKREIGVESRFAVVTLRTASTVTEILLQQVDRSLEGLEWALGKLRYGGLMLPGKSLSHRGSEQGWVIL